MTPEIYHWAERMLVEWELDRALAYSTQPPNEVPLRVLEVGSYNRHPPTEPGGLRDLITAAAADYAGVQYTGIDLERGPGVDFVMEGSDPQVAGLGPFDLAVYTEVMEHDATFWLTWRNINQALQWGGHLLVSTCANGFPQHDYPADHYRFSMSGLMAVAGHFGFRDIDTYHAWTPEGYPSVMGLFRKHTLCVA